MIDISQYFYLSDVSDKIDSLTAEAARTRGQKDKKQLLTEAQGLADAYEKHIGLPSDKHLFNKIT